MKRSLLTRPHLSHDWLFTLACLLLSAACSGSDGNSGGQSSGDTGSGTSASSGSGGSGSGDTTSDGATGSGGGSTSDAGGSGGTESASGGSGGGTSATTGDAGSAGSAGDCGAVVETHELETGYHVTECSAIEYSTNPPCTGEHYPVWAAYQTYDFAVPRGYWVHSLEHGAIVITYNCDDGCPEEVAQVQAMIDDLPEDLRCAGTGLNVQVILTPDPLLDVRWGLSSWGDTLRADCLDLDAFEEFYFDNVGQAPEDICGGGVALTEDTLTPGCGE